MRLHDQRYVWGEGPRGEPCGDCFRTCIASLLEVPVVDEVPHFVEMTMGMPRSGGWHSIRLARHWLREELDIDLAAIVAEEHPTLPFLVDIPKAQHWIVRSWDGSIYHDPSPRRRSEPRFEVEATGGWYAFVRPYDPEPEEWQRTLERHGDTAHRFWPERYELLLDLHEPEEVAA